MLIPATTTAGLLANVGSISTDVFTSAVPYLLVAIGIPLAFYIIKRLISLIPKGR
jgi:predicted RND superfamily exporter protein